MPVVLVVVGLALTSVGYAVERQRGSGFNRGKAVGLALFVVGEIMLFGEGWWWGVMGCRPAITVPTLVTSGFEGGPEGVGRCAHSARPPPFSRHCPTWLLK